MPQHHLTSPSEGGWRHHGAGTPVLEEVGTSFTLITTEQSGLLCTAGQVALHEGIGPTGQNVFFPQSSVHGTGWGVGAVGETGFFKTCGQDIWAIHCLAYEVGPIIITIFFKEFIFIF